MRALLVVLAMTAVTAAAPCERLRAAANAAWGADVAAVACRPVKGRSGMMLVEARPAPRPDDLAIAYAALVDPRTGEVAWQAVGAPGTPGSRFALSFADLDGDGDDELLVHTFHEGHMGFTSEHLDVLRVRAGEASEAATLVLALGVDHRDGNSCANKGLALVGGRTRRLRVVTEYTALPGLPPPQGCPPEGTHDFRLARAGLVLAD